MKDNKEEKAIQPVQATTLVKMMPFRDVNKWYGDFVKFSQKILKEDRDYGVIPGVQKPSLLKPGAEKLRFVYRLQTKTEQTEREEDLENGYLSYSYRTTVFSPTGEFLADCEGNANSFEPKFRYIWVKEFDIPEGVEKNKLKLRDSSISEFSFAIDKAETTGQYGKPAEYWQKFKDAIANGTAKKIWRKTRAGKQMEAYEIRDAMYRVENPDIVGLKNNLMKIAQKRSFVGAIMLATGASEFFTQDVEEMESIVGHEDAIKAVDDVVNQDTDPDWMMSDEERAAKAEFHKNTDGCTCGSTGKYHAKTCPLFKSKQA